MLLGLFPRYLYLLGFEGFIVGIVGAGRDGDGKLAPFSPWLGTVGIVGMFGILGCIIELHNCLQGKVLPALLLDP